MRQIVLDTETTGLLPDEDHRIIEIAAIELANRRPTGRDFWHYLDPGRPIDPGATAVHGLRNQDLEGKPGFAEIAEAFLDFVDGSQIIIHNAPFDLAFLNHELRRIGARVTSLENHCSILDTLPLARRQYPGQNNSLEALCQRFGVDTSNRRHHGARLDAYLLAEVYRAMTRGQAALGFGTEISDLPTDPRAGGSTTGAPRPTARVRVDPDDWSRHRAFLARIDQQCGGRLVWRSDLDPERAEP
jgi:DNA polymerase-3 subunit epsilon